MTKHKMRIGAMEEVDARCAAKAVQVASGYDASLHLLTGNTSVNLKSIMGMMTLHLVRGDEVTLTAEGADEKNAIEGLTAFFGGAE